MPKSNIDTVLFDFFDVVQSEHQKAWLAEYEQDGGDIRPFLELSHQLDLGRISIGEYYEGYARGHKDPEMTAQQVRDEYNRLSVVDTGVVELIEELRESGIKVGLVSNTSSDSIGPYLENNGLREIFDDIVISGDLGVAKPHPEIYKTALNNLGTTANRAVFTDDNVRNIEGAQEVGIEARLFTGVDKLREDLTELGVL